jgi:O-antigen/teichoic acid export membrane protein
MQEYNSSRFGKAVIRFASSQLLSHLLRLVAGLLIVRSLNPDAYGLYNGTGAFLGYILLGHGGIINGMNRELPFQLGKGNRKYAENMASSVWVLSIGLSGVVALVFACLGLAALYRAEWLMASVYFSYVVSGGLHLLNKQFLPALYRTGSEFDALGRQNIALGFLNLATVVFVWTGGTFGLVLRGVFLSIAEAWLLFKNKPFHLRFRYKLRHFTHLFHTGWPIFVVGSVNLVWTTLMSSVLYTHGGALAFGLYAVSSIVEGSMGIIPAAMSQMIYPRMAMMLGAGNSVRNILKSSLRPVIFQFFVLLALGIVGALLLPVVIPWLLPRYSGGAGAACWMVFVPAARAFSALNAIYNVVGKQLIYLVALVSGAVSGTVFVLLKLKMGGFQLEYFTQGLLLGTIIQQTVSLLSLAVLYHEQSTPGR